MRALRLVVAAALAASLGLAPAGATPATYDAPFTASFATLWCPPEAGADCVATPAFDLSSGAVAADLVVSSGERPVGYGTAWAHARVGARHVLDQPVKRVPVTVSFESVSASATAGTLHSLYESTGLVGEPPASSVYLYMTMTHSKCSSYTITASRRIASSFPGEGPVTDADMTLSAYLRSPCYSYLYDPLIPAGTITITAGFYVVADLGALLIDPDVGSAEAHASAIVTSIAVSDYVAPPARMEHATYGESPLGERPCPYPLISGQSVPKQEVPGPCFELGEDETQVSRITVTDASGLSTAFAISYLDARGYSLGSSGGYAGTYCGTMTTPVPFARGAKYVLVRLPDGNWPGYGIAPKCRGVVATRGSVSVEFG